MSGLVAEAMQPESELYGKLKAGAPRRPPPRPPALARRHLLRCAPGVPSLSPPPAPTPCPPIGGRRLLGG